jgi:hypothetical protein
MSRELKRMPRNPERFEAIDLFDSFLNRRASKLSDQSIEQAFIQTLSEEINRSRANPIVIHGRRVESMFGYVAASLGKCVAIKKADTGELYATDAEIRPPDYRIVLDDGYEFLVEVKNHRPKKPTAPYHFRKIDFLRLLRYAEVFQRDLKIAIYWSAWNIWTLNSAKEIDADKKQPSIDLPLAAKHSEMSLLGDQKVATTPPLVWRFKPDPQKPVVFDDSCMNFTIGSVELYCGDTLIEDTNEQNLALYLMLFGRWPASDPQPRINNNILQAVDIVAVPDTPSAGQPFTFVGDLSGMISRYYDFLTTSEYGVERLRPIHEPGTLGVVMPLECRYLKLWRFIIHKGQQPSSSGLVP